MALTGPLVERVGPLWSIRSPLLSETVFSSPTAVYMTRSDAGSHVARANDAPHEEGPAASARDAPRSLDHIPIDQGNGVVPYRFKRRRSAICCVADPQIDFLAATGDATSTVRKALTALAFAIVPLTIACSGGIDHPMDCNKVLQLRLGQSPEEVRALIGEPRFAGQQGTSWQDGTPRTDYVFIYGNSQSGNTVLVGTRDEMSVDFLKGRLVEVSAYRMRVSWGEHDKGTTALMLGSRDYGYRTPAFHTIGPAFTQVFRCGPDFSLDRARAQFEVESSR